MRHTMSLAVVLMLPAGSGWAASPEVVKTAPGQPVRLGYYSVFKKDCSAGPPPEIVVKRPATSGVVIVQPGTLTTTRLRNCPKSSAPVRQVIYRPKAGFTGTDEVAFDVVNPANGTVDSHTVSIVVGTPPTRI